MPKRVQMRRDRPWRGDHPDAVIVARPSKWGNPFTVADAVDVGYKFADAAAARDFVVDAFRRWLADSDDVWTGPKSIQRRAWVLGHITELRGKDLACWCPLDQPCHADVLLELANPPT